MIEPRKTAADDPNPRKGARVETLDWFNDRLVRVPNCLMYKPP